MMCGGRVFDPTLAENEVLEVLRDDVDEDLVVVEDDREGIRGGPARVVAFTAGFTSLELGGAAGFDLTVSPALSTSVFLFGAGSGTEEVRRAFWLSRSDVQLDS